MLPNCQFQLLLLPYLQGAVFAGGDKVALMEGDRSHRVKMGAKIGLMHPIVIFDYDDGVIGGDIGLVEDEGLFFRGCPFVFALLE
jgi:hypothetical protein